MNVFLDSCRPNASHTSETHLKVSSAPSAVLDRVLFLRTYPESESEGFGEFNYVSAVDILGDTGRTENIGAHWEALSEDTTACFSADRKLATYLMHLAEVC